VNEEALAHWGLLRQKGKKERKKERKKNVSPTYNETIP